MSGSPAAPQPFAHLGVPLSSRYRDILKVFVRAKDRFVVHLRPEDIQVELEEPLELAAVGEALAKLAEWGNLRPDPDTGRVTTPEDFNRPRFIYQLTAAGEAAEQAIAVYEQAIGRRGVLQSVALADIVSQLKALLVLAEQESPDAASSHLLLLSISERFTGLADNAQAFMASLRRAIDFADSDVNAFIAYKERLIDYIERFIADLANQGAEIAGLAHRIEQAGVRPLLEAAARREAADAAPGADDAFAIAFEDALARWQSRWTGLRNWFVSAGGSHPSQAKLLRSAAIAAIAQLLGAVSALNERRSGRSDRSADFRSLALWFAKISESNGHRLWRAAFGMTSARHLTVTAKSLESWAESRSAASTPWKDAPPLEISPQLRKTGSYERRGGQNRIIEREQERRFLAEQAKLESAQTARARAQLVTNGPTLLSEMAELDPVAFRLFLALLGDALASKAPEASEVDVTTSDGTMRVRLSVVPGGGIVQVHTLDGVLTGPQHLIEIVDLTVTPALAEAR